MLDFLAATCNYETALEISPKPQFLIVNNLLYIDTTTKTLKVLKPEYDLKPFREMMGVYPVLRLNNVNCFTERCWGRLNAAMVHYQKLYRFTGYYLMIEKILPLSFYNYNMFFTRIPLLTTCIIEVSDPGMFTQDMLHRLGSYSRMVVCKSYDHFEYDEDYDVKVSSHDHCADRTIDMNIEDKFNVSPQKILLKLSTHGTLYNHETKPVLIRRGDIMETLFKGKPIDEELSYDDAKDIYHKLNVFIGAMGYLGVITENIEDDLIPQSRFSVYGLCRHWDPSSQPPDESSLAPNQLVPRKCTRSDSISVGGRAIPVEIDSTIL